MAFFSLLEPQSGSSESYEAERCHINVWSLPGWLGHRPMLFDVGLMFRSVDRITAIEMALPVRAAPRIRDLVGTISNPEVGTLLFGKSYNGHTADGQLLLKVKIDGAEETKALQLVGVDEKKSNFFHEDPSLVAVSLALSQPVEPGETAYIRARFVVDHSGAMWRWQRVLGRRNGALIDFRVPDPREERQHDRSPIEKRAKPMGELDAFFILPDRFRLQAANPELTYTRTLEGESWHPYLRRSVNGLSRYRPGHQRLMVHRWHPVDKDGEARPVGRDRPFRGFLQFDRAPSFRAPSDLLLVVFATAAVFYLLFHPLSVNGKVGEDFDWLEARIDDLIRLGVVVIALIGIGFVYNIVSKWKKLPSLMKRLKREFKKAEYRWFKLFT